MFHRTWRRAGTYVLNECLVNDWWQPFYREDAHKKAQKRLHDALRLVEAQRNNNSTTTSSSHTGDAHSPTSEPGMTLEGPSLFEINALIGTFTAVHNVEDLGVALQYVHETLGQALTPFHYHALLRTFSYQHDRDNALQLLTVMAQRGELTLETYARVMDMLHCLSPQDILPRLLRVVALAQDGFGTLVQVTDAAGSEHATVAAFLPGEAREAALADPTVMPGQAHAAEVPVATTVASRSPLSVPGTAEGDEAASASPRRVSPALTALLHHVANSGACSPVAALLVVVWIRALGVSLGDWDTALTLSALLSKPEDFPRVRATTGYFANTPLGVVTPQQFLERLAERGELTPASAPLCALAEAMRASLAAAEVDMTRPVFVGVVNTHTTSLDTLVERILSLAAQPGSPRGVGAEEGFSGCHADQIYHYVMLLHGTMKSYTAAVRTLGEVLTRKQDQIASDETQLAAREFTEPVDSRTSGDVALHCVMDGGALLPSVSAAERRAVEVAYRAAVRRVAQLARENALREATGVSLHTSAAAQAANAPNLAVPPTAPSLADAANCEGYALLFVHTTAEARLALSHVLGSIQPGTARLPRSVRFAFRQLVHFCVQHPRANSKMTPAGLAERRRWARYLDARDTALNLFGSGQRARDMMKQLFYDESAMMPALRSAEVVTRDVSDMTTILFPGLAERAATTTPTQSSSTSSAPAAVTTNTTEGKDGRAETALARVEATALLVQQTMVEPRATLPHLRCSPHIVAPYLYEPNVYNPFPHAMLSLPADKTPQAGCGGAAAEEEEEDAATDFFAELWQAIVNPSASGHGDLHWYVQDTDMYLLLLRCLVHRLDWEAAVHLTTKMMEHNNYTHRMDHEITQMFREAGDPAGFLSFKVATRLFDGRIVRDGQAKRGHADPMEDSR